MFKNFVIGFVAVLALVSVGMASNVQAKLGKVLGVEKTAEQPVQLKLSLTDCDQGLQVLNSAGFSHLFATDCSGAQYQFNGFRGETEYTIVFNAHSNGFATISK